MCLYPRLIKNKRYLMYNAKAPKKGNATATTCDDERKLFIAIGCGECIECRKQKAREWQIRLTEELPCWKYKYFATIIGGAICGLGGLYFVMDFCGGTWTNGGLGENGWLAVALVIFATWKPLNAIWGSLIFGGLCILYLYIPGLNAHQKEMFKALPYIITIVVLVITSLRKKREQQPPAHLGLPYFREER